MNLDHVLIDPILSEKATTLRERKVFCFHVHPQANKVEIIAAVKRHFNVTPIKCRTIINKPKPKRLRNITGETKRVKKAYVYLKHEDTISMFEGA